MKNLYTVWCEWDISNDGLAFSTKEKAHLWCAKNEHLQEVIDDSGGEFKTVADILAAGLLGIHELEVDA